MTVYDPGGVGLLSDGPLDSRAVFEAMPQQTSLSAPESRLLTTRLSDAERKARETEARPSRSMPSRMRTAVDRWSVEAGWIAVGLEGATVTQAPASQSGRLRGSGPADPTGAQLYRTLDAISDAAVRWAHLTGRCPLDGTQAHDRAAVHVCPGESAADLAALVGIDLDLAELAEVVDCLAGTPSTSPLAFTHAVSHAAAWHSTVASQVQGAFDAAWRGGAEPSLLEDWTSRTQHLARRMAGLAGRLADWSGRVERECRGGCGAPVPTADSGARGGRLCDRCRKRASRACAARRRLLV